MEWVLVDKNSEFRLYTQACLLVIFVRGIFSCEEAALEVQKEMCLSVRCLWKICLRGIYIHGHFK